MFGTAPTLGKFALQTFSSNAIVGFRVAGAAAAFYILQRFRGSLALDKTAHYFQFALFAMLGVALNQLLFFKGLSLTTATNTSLISITIPIFTIIISAIVGHDTLSLRKILGVLVAACGVVYLIDPGKASFSALTTQGDLLIVANSLSYASYVALSKKLISHYGALKSIAWLFIFSIVVSVPIGIFALREIDLAGASASAWIYLAAIVLIPTILAYYLHTWALARVAPSIATVYVYLQPLIGFTLAVIFLKEVLSFRPVIAAALIFAGVFLVTTRNKREVSESQSDLPAINA
jgi:drug/metabolite transporter (DMT)-like permease